MSAEKPSGIRPSARTSESIPNIEEKDAGKRAEKILADILGKAGKHTLDQSHDLMNERLAALYRAKKHGEGTIAEAITIADIKKPKAENYKISEGAVSYLKVENDAQIINASDAHGSFKDLSKSITKFVVRKEKGEHVYFNFSGDVSSGDVDEVVPCMEALASLQARYPGNVTLEFGNGDRRASSLFLGLTAETAQRFSPELDKFLSAAVDKKFQEFLKERGATTPDQQKELAAAKRVIYGFELMKLARLGGTEMLSPKEFNLDFLNPLIKAFLKSPKDAKAEAGKTRRVEADIFLTASLATEPMRDFEKKHAGEVPKNISEQAKKVFEHWRLMDKVLNEQPALAIYENDGAVVLATHTGYVAMGDKLGDLAYNPITQDKAAWDKTYHPGKIGEGGKEEKAGSVEKYGPPGKYQSNPPEYLAPMMEKILPKNKAVAFLTGHNHGNFSERIALSDKRHLLRVENCVSSGKKRAGADASFVELNMTTLATAKDQPETAVRFVKVSEPEKKV